MDSQPEALDSERMGVLKLVAQRGAANAAAGLSQMVGREIRMRAPAVALKTIREVPALLPAPEDELIGVYLAVGGDISGHILLLLSPVEARGLVDLLMGLPNGSTRSLGAMERSALGEVGNLTGSFFLNALSESTGLTAHPSPPAVLADMGAAILQVPLVDLARLGDEVLVIDTYFADDRRQISALFLVMPDAPSLKAMVGVSEKQCQRN